MYDVLIVGGGPAGITAGIFSARKKIRTLLVAKELGGEMAWSLGIQNYTGLPDISGAEMVKRFSEHLKSIPEDLEIKEGAEIVNLEKNITSFAAEDRRGSVYYAKSVIIASGRSPKLLGVPGEKEFFGKGVATCVTCEVPFYKDKTVAVIGGGNSAMSAILALSKVAKKIHCINQSPNLTGDKFLTEKVLKIPGISFHYSARVKEILGDRFVNGIKVTKHGNSEETLKLEGVFVEIGFTPNTSFENITAKNEKGEIKVDNNLQTSVPGIFAAGDVNDAWGEQVIIAAGEGAKAALAANDFLNRL